MLNAMTELHIIEDSAERFIRKACAVQIGVESMGIGVSTGYSKLIRCAVENRRSAIHKNMTSLLERVRSVGKTM
jgi:hypothetical protein